MTTNTKLYFFIRDILAVFARINNRLKVTGLENIPDDGAIVCPYHANFSDPFFVAAAIPDRILHFLAWHGIERMPLIGPLFKQIGAMHSIKESYGVSLDKEETRNVLSEMQKLLQKGELCVIFPEGSIKHWITPDSAIKPFKTGAVRLAAQAGVPIIPTGLTGTRWVVPNVINFYDFGGPDKSFWIPMALPVKVSVHFGEHFYVKPEAADNKDICKEEAERLRQIIIDIIKKMRK